MPSRLRVPWASVIGAWLYTWESCRNLMSRAQANKLPSLHGRTRGSVHQYRSTLIRTLQSPTRAYRLVRFPLPLARAHSVRLSWPLIGGVTRVQGFSTPLANLSRTSQKSRGCASSRRTTGSPMPHTFDPYPPPRSLNAKARASVAQEPSSNPPSRNSIWAFGSSVFLHASLPYSSMPR